nr:uncharacterized protein LOC109163082 [Ipomoea batatas]
MRGAQRLSHSNGCRWDPDEKQAAGSTGPMFVSGKKAKVVRCELDGSDDDFAAPPLSKKSKVSQSQPGVSHSFESNDDFVLPPLTFLARLQKYPVWNAPDHELTTEEDANFPRVKTRAPSAVFVKF